MPRVERGNVVLMVKDHEVQHYLNLGYNLTDDAGNVLKRSIPTNIGELQTAYLEHTKKIAELEDTIAKLTAQLSMKKTTKKVKED
jgi:uncharacterized small protein (DUF1192 family)